jgi:hypothetical protein
MGQDCKAILQAIKTESADKAIELMYANTYWHRIAHHRFKNFERKLNPPYEWQDIFHEAVIRFVQQVKRGAEVQHCESYFGMICHHICFKEVEKIDGRKLPKKESGGSSGELDTTGDGGGDKPKPPTIVPATEGLENLPDPEPQNPMVKMLDLAKHYLSQLEERDRDLLGIKYFKTPNAENMSAQDVAKKWNLDIGSIPPLTTLAKRRWKELMEKNRDEFEDLDAF